MGLTSGARTTITIAAAAMLTGLGTLVHGTIQDDLAPAIAGASLLTVAFLAIALTLIHRWTVDTTDERRALAAAQRQAGDERTRYIAAQAALENEASRLNRDMIAERRALAARLTVEREALEAEFEERRAALISETMEATVLMMQSGKLAAEPTTTGTLIRFPEKLPHQARAREHGVVGP